MGTENSSNDEWIELFNSSNSAVSVDGWTLTDGNNLSIALSGTIAGGSYAVLERTDDNSAPGTAFLIYTGALSNGGATLTLRDSSASSEDIVAGGTDWTNIGGDNTTKETPQRTDSGWVTATATPGSGSLSVGSNEVEEENSGKEESAEASTTNSAYVGYGPYEELKVAILAPKKIYLNQEVTFTATSTGRSDITRNSLAYSWNFGDLHTASGEEVTHTYTYPGKYQIWLTGEFYKYNDEDTVTVEVLPVTLALERKKNGDVLVINEADYAVRIDGHFLVGQKKVTFPPNSTLLAKQGVLVSEQELGASNSVALYDNQDNMITSYGYGNLSPEVMAVVSTTQPDTAPNTGPPITDDMGTEQEEVGKKKADEILSANVIGATKEKGSDSPSTYVLVGFLLLLVLSVFSIFQNPSANN